MAEYEIKDMSGSAFKNRNKRSETHADYTGTVKIHGDELWINIWVKKDKNDNPYFSFSFRKKEPRLDSQQPSQPQKIELSDDIPF